MADSCEMMLRDTKLPEIMAKENPGLYEQIREWIMEKVTEDKANMLSHSDQIFSNAEYLYSLPDYKGNPNIYRWNYFYTPVQIGDTTVGVRIAIRDMATPAESQIYSWGIKKAPTLDGGSPEKTSLSADVSSAGETDASLDGARRLPSDGSFPGGVSSEASEASASTISIPTTAQNVKSRPAWGATISKNIIFKHHASACCFFYVHLSKCRMARRGQHTRRKQHTVKRKNRRSELSKRR